MVPKLKLLKWFTPSRIESIIEKILLEDAFEEISDHGNFKIIDETLLTN